MIYVVTGSPGAKKTAYTVSLLDKMETENKVNLIKNQDYYAKNLEIIQKNGLESDFTYYIDEEGTGDTLREIVKILPEGYFNYFLEDFDDLRPDDYYFRTVIFNRIIAYF